MTLPPLRRVVTGLDADGRSRVLIDGDAAGTIWSSAGSPADNGGDADAGGLDFTFGIPTGGSRLIVHDFPPGGGTAMHATDTLDYIVVLAGEIDFLTETGEVHLTAGDVLVDRGHVHGWRNDGDVPCHIINMLSPAHPVGGGSTV